MYWRRRIKKGFPTKLLIDWQGPFEIIEKKTPVLYKIRTITDPQKTTHANIAHLSKIVSIADIPEDMQRVLGGREAIGSGPDENIGVDPVP